MNLTPIMQQYSAEIRSLVVDGIFDVPAMTVQMAFGNADPCVLKIVLAAIYLAGRISADDARPDPDIWSWDDETQTK